MGEIERWFSYSEDDGFRRHVSAEEAKEAAQAALDGAGDVSGDGWPEDTDSICWGEVREGAVEEVIHKHGPDCRPLAEDEGWGCTEGHTLEFDYLSRFSLTPTTQAGDIDDATARAEAAEQRAAAAEAEVARLRADNEAAENERDIAQREAGRLRAVIAEAVAELPVCAEGAYQTPMERDVSAVRAALLAAVAEAQPAEVSNV
jgi:hypothetical protein